MARAVVTGLGLIAATGSTATASLPDMYRGVRKHRPLSLFSAQVQKHSPVFEVDHPALQNSVSRSLDLAMIAVQEALQQAGLDRDFTKRCKAATAIGTTVGYLFPDHNFYSAFKKEMYPKRKAVEDFLAVNPAVAIAKSYKCLRLAVTVGNACASGTDAVGIAKLWIEQGLCDVVIAGGTDELCRTTYLGFTALLLTSPEACKPFDKNRKGLNLGEGAGILVVESDEHAKKRGAKILVEISGYGCNADAYHPTAPHPHGTGIKRAMTAALKQSGAAQNEIAFVNAHGTSTQENDLVEGKAIAEIVGNSIPVVSTKSFTGHTLGAAGAIEAVFTIQNLLDRKIPPTAGFEIADPACAIVPSQSESTIHGEFAISNSLAFGGQNSVLVFRAAS